MVRDLYPDPPHTSSRKWWWWWNTAAPGGWFVAQIVMHSWEELANEWWGREATFQQIVPDGVLHRRRSGALNLHSFHQGATPLVV